MISQIIVFAQNWPTEYKPRITQVANGVRGDLALEEERSAANHEFADGLKMQNPGVPPETSGFSTNPSFLKVMVA